MPTRLYIHHLLDRTTKLSDALVNAFPELLERVGEAMYIHHGRRTGPNTLVHRLACSALDESERRKWAAVEPSIERYSVVVRVGVSIACSADDLGIVQRSGVPEAHIEPNEKTTPRQRRTPVGVLVLLALNGVLLLLLLLSPDASPPGESPPDARLGPSSAGFPIAAFERSDTRAQTAPAEEMSGTPEGEFLSVGAELGASTPSPPSDVGPHGVGTPPPSSGPTVAPEAPPSPPIVHPVGPGAPPAEPHPAPGPGPGSPPAEHPPANEPSPKPRPRPFQEPPEDSPAPPAMQPEGPDDMPFNPGRVASDWMTSAMDDPIVERCFGSTWNPPCQRPPPRDPPLATI